MTTRPKRQRPDRSRYERQTCVTTLSYSLLESAKLAGPRLAPISASPWRCFEVQRSRRSSPVE